MLEVRGYSYSDLNPDPQAESSLLLDDEALFAQIENYLNTSKDERLFRPGEGGDPHSLLFELAYDDEGAFELYARVMTELPAAVPRAKLIPAKCIFTPEPDYNRMSITLAFTIEGRGDKVYLFEAYLMS